MKNYRSNRVLIMAAAAALLSSCSFINDTLMPSLSGEDPSHQPVQSGETVQIPPSEAEQNPQPTLSAPGTPTQGAPEAAQPGVAATPLPPAMGTGSYQPEPVTPGANTGTYVGQKVAGLRGDLARLQGNIDQHNQQLQQLRQQMAQDATTYYTDVGAINSHLQLGTTPGNPQLVAQWNQAQTELNRLSDGIGQLNGLSNATATDSALAAYILETVRATYGLEGAVDEDHRQLHVLENDCNRTVVLIDRLLNDLSEDISRQSTYVGTERRNLTMLSVAIKNGELYGGSLANRAFSTASGARTAGLAGGAQQPLVVIRFDRPNVPYEKALYTAVSQALDRRPGATFDVVAVSPNTGGVGEVALNSNTSKRDAETVVRSLTNMGLPADRISLSATTSASAQTNEVQIFVR